MIKDQFQHGRVSYYPLDNAGKRLWLNRTGECHSEPAGDDDDISNLRSVPSPVYTYRFARRDIWPMVCVAALLFGRAV